MNVLVLSNCPLKESQGSGYVIVNTTNCLRSQGHEVNLIGPEKMDLLSFLGSTAQIYRIMFGMAWWILVNKVKKYDLIIFYGAESFIALYLIKSILKIKTPIVLHSNGLEVWVDEFVTKHELIGIKKWYHFNLNNYFQYCYNAVDALLTVSKEQYDYAIHILKIDKSKVFYNNLALPDLYFKSNNLIEKQKYISFCGSWLSRKGVLPMAKALETILAKYPDYKFRLIGVGEDFDLPAHFSFSILSSIELIPFVSDKVELMNLYKETEIFLFPSQIESFGLVLAEAMYCGCACITGPTGFAIELKNNEEAIVLQEVNTETILDALENLINNTALRENIAINAGIKVRDLTWGNFNIKLSEILKIIE